MIVAAPSYLERVVLGEERGFFSWALRLLLLPFSLLYGIGLSIYLSAYSIGLRKKCKLGVPVISIGNLTFGGTGKTPAVQALCRMLVARGLRVVILSRGHGRSAGGCEIVSDGERILVNSGVSGDEPMLLAESLPGVPVIVCKDRRISGRLACDRFSPDVIVLDDGLQYWQLYRDMDIVVLDATKPFGSGFVMPMGDLREPASGLRRASVVLLSHCNGLDTDSRQALIRRLRPLAPSAGFFFGSHQPVDFVEICSGKHINLDWIRGRRVVAFCGIGRPVSFFDMLTFLGAVIEELLVFPDHHNYTNEDMDRITGSLAASSADVIVTTEKDSARLGNSPALRNLYTLSIEFEIEEHGNFEDYILRGING